RAVSASALQSLALLAAETARAYAPKTAWALSTAGIADVKAGGQRGRSEQNHRKAEWHGNFRPAQRHDDPGHAQSGDRIENIDELLGARFVLIKPGMTVVISHRQNAVVSLLAKFEDRPGGSVRHE